MKVTKGHFNRRALFFGLLLFLAVSLISTGFAAWIMSTGADKQSSSSVNVGTITDGSLEFSDIVLQEGKNEIVFDALMSDQTGDIKGSLAKDEKDENLSIVFTTSLTPATYVQDLTISIKVPATVKAAADAGYITMPTCCYVEGNPVLNVELIKNGEKQSLTGTGIDATIEKAADSDTYNITITVNFGWGIKFGGENPGLYLDTPELNLSYDQKVQNMLDFKRTIYGLAKPADANDVKEGEATDEQVLAYKPTLPFDITLNAVAK